MASHLHDLVHDDRPPPISAYLNTKAEGTVAFADIAGSPETGYYVEIVWMGTHPGVYHLPTFASFLEAKRAATDELAAIACNYSDSEIRWRF